MPNLQLDTLSFADFTVSYTLIHTELGVSADDTVETVKQTFLTLLSVLHRVSTFYPAERPLSEGMSVKTQRKDVICLISEAD